MPPHSSVHAHKLNTSYTNLIAEDDALKVRVRMDDFDLLKIGVDQDGDSLLYYEEIEAGLDDIFAFVEKQMRLRANGEPLTLVRDRGDITPDNKGNMFANVYFSAELEEPVNELEVWVGWPERFGDAHKNLAKIMLPGQPLVQAVFSASSPQQTFAGEKSLWDHLYEFTVLGVEHIFLGYDHVMFLLALIVVGGRLLSLVKVVTAFTVAHSITLCLAALEIVRLPSQWIEAGIALSIVYVAVENFLAQAHGVPLDNHLCLWAGAWVWLRQCAARVGAADRGAGRLAVCVQRRRGNRPSSYCRARLSADRLAQPAVLSADGCLGGVGRYWAFWAGLVCRAGFGAGVYAAVRLVVGRCTVIRYIYL